MSDKSLKIYFNIQDSKPKKDDILLVHSEIKDIKTYKALLEYQLRKIFNNKSKIEENLISLQDLINENIISIEIIKLNKNQKEIISKSFLKQSNKSNNNVFVFNLEKISIDNKLFNQIAIWVDIEHKKNENNSFFLINATRIEFFMNNSSNSKQKNTNAFCEFSINTKKETQPIILIENCSIKNVFDKNDYHDDKLQLDIWANFLKHLWDAYNIKNIDEINTRLLRFNNNFVLISKIHLSNKNLKNFVLKNERNDNKELKIKNFNFAESDNNFKKSNYFLNYLDNELEKNKNLIEENQIILPKEKKKIEDEENILSKLVERIKAVSFEIENNDFEKIRLSKEKKLKSSNEYKKDKKQENKNYLNNINKKIQEIDTKNKDLSEKLTSLEKDKKNRENLKKIYQQKILNVENELKQLERQNKQIEDVINYVKKNNFNYVYKLADSNGIIFQDEKLDENNQFDNIASNLIDYYFESNESIELPWYITTTDIATFTKIKRLFFAIRQLQGGYYKNFNLFKSIKNPSNIFYFHEIDNQIKQKYKLNRKQESAIRKALNTNDLFYLQGPPGTGKTQVLCAIAESISKKNENLVMCSSTHEAIDNFLERLHFFNKDNPNFVIFKYRFIDTDNKDKDSLFSESNLFKNWKNAIYEKLSPSTNSASKESWEKYVQSFGKKIPDAFVKKQNLKIFPESFLSLFEKNIELINKNIDIIKNDDEFIKPISIYVDNIEKSDFKEFYRNYQSFKKSLNSVKEEEQIDLFNNLINSLDISNEDVLFNLINYLKKIDHSNFFGLIHKEITKFDNKENHQIKVIRNYFKDRREVNNSLEKEFKDYIFENELINVIGISTTSRLNIKLNNKEKSLFNEYQVDTILIDEVSKSSTPEIISKAVLAKKIILSGDYLQLPPSSEFDDDKTILKLIDKDLFHFDNIENEEKNDLEETENKIIDMNEAKIKEVRNWINDLFKTSFFVIQVSKIKNKQISSKNLAYEFLQESWRFSGNILKIVNLIYPKDEKLIEVYNEQIKYNLSFRNRNYDSDLVICDISNPDLAFFKKDHEINEITFKKSFDQSGKTFIVRNNKEIKLEDQNASYNQYSARVISILVNKLLEENLLNEKRRIGIITLTKNQKIVINNYLSFFCKEKNYKKLVKVDTIDNFQGREEEIIIVDFIRGKSKIDNRKIITPKNRNISFLEQIERINVALSRAKNKLILVGFFDEYLKKLEIKDKGRLFNDYLDLCKDKSDSYIQFSKEFD